MSDATPNESFLQRHSRDVVERLIRQMEEGTGPFLKPWDARVDLGLPMNPTTGKSYLGGNLLHLWALQSAWDTQDNRWMTYKQAAAVGAQVRKGEKASVIEYWGSCHPRAQSPISIRPAKRCSRAAGLRSTTTGATKRSTVR